MTRFKGKKKDVARFFRNKIFSKNLALLLCFLRIILYVSKIFKDNLGRWTQTDNVITNCVCVCDELLILLN